MIFVILVKKRTNIYMFISNSFCKRFYDVLNAKMELGAIVWIAFSDFSIEYAKEFILCDISFTTLIEVSHNLY
jgi:hypothetical protein